MLGTGTGDRGSANSRLWTCARRWYSSLKREARNTKQYKQYDTTGYAGCCFDTCPFARFVLHVLTTNGLILPEFFQPSLLPLVDFLVNVFGWRLPQETCVSCGKKVLPDDPRGPSLKDPAHKDRPTRQAMNELGQHFDSIYFPICYAVSVLGSLSSGKRWAFVWG